MAGRAQASERKGGVYTTPHYGVRPYNARTAYLKGTLHVDPRSYVPGVGLFRRARAGARATRAGRVAPAQRRAAGATRAARVQLRPRREPRWPTLDGHLIQMGDFVS